MKVLISIPPLDRAGGISGYFRTSVPHFTRPVDLVVRGSHDGGGARTAVRVLRDYAAFTRRLLAGRHRLVHLNTSFGTGGLVRDAALVLLTKLLRRRLFLFVHGWDARLAGKMRGPRLALFRAVYFRADGMAVLAGEFRDRLREWGYRGPISLETTIAEDACSVDPAALAPRDPAEPFTVLFMARLHPTKGVLTAIDAVARLHADGVPVRLIVAGTGEAMDEARERAARAGIDAEFPGYVLGPDKVAALRRAHAYVLPTTHGEGMPTTVLEAMAAGLPVVTRPVGGVRDFFEDGGMGYLTESTEPAVFAELLGRLARDEPLRLGMGRRAAEFAAERFLASRVVARLERIYDEVLAA